MFASEARKAGVPRFRTHGISSMILDGTEPMKVLLASIAVFVGLAGLGMIVVFDQAAPTRGYVADLIPDDIEDRDNDSLDGALAALRSLGPGNGDPDPSATTTDDSPDGAPANDPIESPTDNLAFEIAGTAGEGVSYRSACSDDARVDGGIEEGAAVSIVSAGTGPCAGWTLVRDETTAVQTWVRDRFVGTRGAEPPGGAPTLAAAPDQPTATPVPASTPVATASPTATPAPSPQPTPAAATPSSWFGRVAGVPGDTVSASIGGVECAATSVYDRDGEAYYYLAIAEDAPCRPSEGATVVLTLNGVPASTAGVWLPGASSPLPLP